MNTNDNVGIGYKGYEHLFLSLEDRGIAYYYVAGVLQLRPMTEAELAARNARKDADDTGLKITITDGNGDFIRNDHDAQKL